MILEESKRPAGHAMPAGNGEDDSEEEEEKKKKETEEEEEGGDTC